MQFLPGHVARLRTGQKSHGVGHIFGFSEVTQGDLGQQSLLLLGRQTSRHVRVDETRRHAVDGDVAAAQFSR